MAIAVNVCGTGSIVQKGSMKMTYANPFYDEDGARLYKHESGCTYKDSNVPPDECPCKCFTLIETNVLDRLDMYAHSAQKFLLDDNNAVRAFTYIEEVTKILDQLYRRVV